MALFFNRKRHIAIETEADRKAAAEAQAIRNQTHRKLAQTNRDITKLNELLEANGITFKIHLAAGGKNGN